MSDLVNRIEKRIKEKGTNFKRVEQELGLGNGTIKRWSTQSPRLDKLVPVAEYLQVSLDYLVFGSSVSETSTNGDRPDLEAEKERQGLTCDGLPLAEDEVDLVAMYRLLPPSHREEIFDLVYFKYKRHVEEKKESIYSTYFDGSEDEKSGPAGSREARDGTA
ncbi:MAG: XRE family transcriptional regulator [Flintibacter sp.]|uniref:helix-turn-helix domain-containing protein n=1 Tax=Flintibacter sp. TaxID=1918624 RepID=UPI002D7E2897|nr:helix-turn-helix domain-containing protein [Flintibacter sp.]MCI7158362.1 XRE family transcriptional regulator [Flintibacter sp.]